MSAGRGGPARGDARTRGRGKNESDAGHDYAVEQLIGRLLQLGVLIAAVVVAVGGLMLLARMGGHVADFSRFVATPGPLSTLGGIVRGVAAMEPGAIVQLGLVLLILTPVARVAFSLVAFALERDGMYVLVSAIVLAILIYGLVWGKA